jgi:hypothetical protein
MSSWHKYNFTLLYLTSALKPLLLSNTYLTETLFAQNEHTMLHSNRFLTKLQVSVLQRTPNDKKHTKSNMSLCCEKEEKRKEENKLEENRM